MSDNSLIIIKIYIKNLFFLHVKCICLIIYKQTNIAPKLVEQKKSIIDWFEKRQTYRLMARFRLRALTRVDTDGFVVSISLLFLRGHPVVLVTGALLLANCLLLLVEVVPPCCCCWLPPANAWVSLSLCCWVVAIVCPALTIVVSNTKKNRREKRFAPFTCSIQVIRVSNEWAPATSQRKAGWWKNRCTLFGWTMNGLRGRAFKVDLDAIFCSKIYFNLRKVNNKHFESRIACFCLQNQHNNNAHSIKLNGARWRCVAFLVHTARTMCGTSSTAKQTTSLPCVYTSIYMFIFFHPKFL